MPMSMFHTYFPEIAARETRTVTLANHADLPDGEYGLVELYCDELNCDCRRVIFWVVSAPPSLKQWATINYGWESAEFYGKWLGDEDLGAEAAGASLEPFGTQSQYSKEWLAIVERVLMDDEYVQRLQRHYAMFKEAINAKAAAKRSRQPAGRGAGKKRRR